MDFTTNIHIIFGKNSLFVYIDKPCKFYWLVFILMGKGELSAKKVSLLFFDFIMTLFGVTTSGLHNRDVHFATYFW